MHHELITADMRTTSRVVAEKFGKRHDNVLRDIARLLNFEESNLPKGFTDLNFEFSSYLDSTGRSLPQYELTRDGFTLLAMGFTGKAAMAWKIRFIEAFNLMEAELKRRTTPPSREVPVYDDPLSNREWLALIRETRLANGTGAAQRVYAQSPFADYLREKDGPQHIAEPRPLTPEQEAQLGGFDMTLTEEAVLRAVHRSHAGPGSMRKTTQELGYLANIGPEEAHEACTRLSAFDLIRRNHFRRKLWDVTERGMQVLRAIDHNRREQST